MSCEMLAVEHAAGSHLELRVVPMQTSKTVTVVT